MKIKWTNGDEFWGTVDVSIRWIQDPVKMSTYCKQKGALGCHHDTDDNASQINVTNPFNNKMVLLETISHELLHCFTGTMNGNHDTPLTKRNTIDDPDAPHVKTPAISSFYDRNLKKLGVAVLRVSGMTIERV